jgi:hypothetical protein
VFPLLLSQSLKQNLIFACYYVTTKKNTAYVQGCYGCCDGARTFFFFCEYLAS